VLSWGGLFPIFVFSKLFLNVIYAVTDFLYINLDIFAKVTGINLDLAILIGSICIPLPISHRSQGVHTHSVDTFFD
jgi:hypothetical protein